MCRKHLAVLGLLMCQFLSSSPVWAHHSTAMFDTARLATYHGVITKIVWANPHCFIYFDGTPDNAPAGAPVEHWGVEGQSPNVMFNHGGWDEDTAKVGDKIVVTGNPRKDGQPTMLLINAVIKGKTYEVMARQSINSEKK